MGRRRGSAVLCLAFAVSACSGGGDGDAADTTATRPSAAPAVTASISTVPATTAAPATTVAATTTASPTTAVPTTAPAAGGPTSAPPSCADQPNAPVCVGVTVPLPADADAIVSRYRAFAAKHLEVQANPDAPDWDGLLAFVVPDRRAEARQELAQRFARGEALDVSLGVTLDPRLSRLRYPDDFIELLDCRQDGSYWVDRATGQPVAGEQAAVRTRPFVVQLKRIDGTWYLNGYEYGKGTC